MWVGASTCWDAGKKVGGGGSRCKRRSHAELVTQNLVDAGADTGVGHGVGYTRLRAWVLVAWVLGRRSGCRMAPGSSAMGVWHCTAACCGDSAPQLDQCARTAPHRTACRQLLFPRAGRPVEGRRWLAGWLAIVQLYGSWLLGMDA